MVIHQIITSVASCSDQPRQRGSHKAPVRTKSAEHPPNDTTPTTRLERNTVLSNYAQPTPMVADTVHGVGWPRLSPKSGVKSAEQQVSQRTASLCLHPTHSSRHFIAACGIHPMAKRGPQLKSCRWPDGRRHNSDTSSCPMQTRWLSRRMGAHTQ